MRSCFTVTLFVLILTGGTVPASAADSATVAPPCLEQAAAQCRLGKWIRIVSHDSTEYEGGLLSISADYSTLKIEPWYTASRTPVVFQRDDIARIQYSKGAKKYRLIGLAGGAALGLLIGAVYEATDNDEPDCNPWFPGFCEEASKWERAEGYVVGTLVGAGVGFLGGAILTQINPPTVTIECQ